MNVHILPHSEIIIEVCSSFLSNISVALPKDMASDGVLKVNSEVFLSLKWLEGMKRSGNTDKRISL